MQFEANFAVTGEGILLVVSDMPVACCLAKVVVFVPVGVIDVVSAEPMLLLQKKQFVWWKLK